MDFEPAIVIEAHDACADSVKADGWVRESMRGSMSPRGIWTVRVSSVSPLHVIGVLEDEHNLAVAHRDMYLKSSHECEGTMHAVGVWASLVLDTEVGRSHEREAEALRVASQSTQDTANTSNNVPAVTDTKSAVVTEDADGGVPRKHVSRIEIGASSMLASGVGGLSPTYVGASAFVFVEAGFGLFLRPSVTYGHSLGDLSVNWGSSRFDLCGRVPGNYIDRRGLQLDVCFGPEAGIMSLRGSDQQSRIRPLFGFGPTISLRGELASDLAVEVRGASAYNIVHGEELDPIAPLSLRAEVGLSWGLR